jgi:16S rRNA (cytidine1402-2'-O)-methyltransferase
MGQLYIVSTPIGNLSDISYRAVEILAAVNRVLAEDTRRTAILFRRYGIQTPLYSAHAHNEQARAGRILEWLRSGEQVALVSDAGTPLVSDPGARIVTAVLAAGHQVVPIPGASSILTALVGSGLEPEPFTFFGFVPRSGADRRERLSEIANLPHTSVLFEAPGRVARLLQDLVSICGGERKAVVARELTKVHETFVRGTLTELAGYYREEVVRGEVVVLIAGTEAAEGEATGAGEAEETEARAVALAREQLAQGKSPRDIAKRIAHEVGLPRNRAYEITQAAVGQSGGPEA